MNKSIFLKHIFFLLCFFTFSITIHSQNFDTKLNLQDSTQTHIIILKSGKKLKGQILKIQNDKVFFLSKKKKEKSTLTLSQIREIKVDGHLDWHNKKYKTPFQYSQILFYSNTGFSLQEGEKSYRTFMGASMLWNRGVTNRFEIGASYSFPFYLGVNMKISSDHSGNHATAFKSYLLTMPILLLSDDEDFYVLENTLSQSFGTPDRFFNLSFSNYWIKRDQYLSFGRSYFPIIYNSASIGGGIRMNEHWFLMIESNVNFNTKFIDAKLLPSFGLSYATPKFNVAFGFHSAHDLGFNLFPILEFNEDDFVVFAPEFLSRLPYFTFSRIF